MSPSPDPMQALFAQFSQFLVDEGFSQEDWEMVAKEYGVNEIAANTDRFYRSWVFDDEDRRKRTVRFLEKVHEMDESLALGIMRRAYSMVEGADEEVLQKYPALETLENEDSEVAHAGLPQIPVQSERFLDIDNVPGTFYPELVEDINKCYRIGIYDATLVLTRKLLENLLIDVLRKQYGTDNIETYYIPERSQFVGFNSLIDNFENNLDDFEHLSGELDDDFIAELDTFRQTANAGAHSIETDLDDAEIEEYRDRARHTVKVLFRVYGNMS